MAEKTIFDPRASRATEAHLRRLPFAPIFDTIVAERPSESPLTSEEPVTKVFAPREESNGFRARTAIEPEIRREEEGTFRRFTPMTWIAAAGYLVLAGAVILQNIQLGRQEKTLNQVEQDTSRLASSLADARNQEQRPWITLSEPIPQPLSVAPGSFAVSLQNTGKTPAMDVKVAATAQVGEVPYASALPPVGPVNLGAGTLFPGSQFRAVLDFHPPAAVFTALFRGQGRLEMHVNVSYEDVQHNQHVTQSCWQWRPTLRQMQSCSTFNTVN